MQKLWRYIGAIVIAGALIGGLVLLSVYPARREPAPSNIEHAGPTVEQVQALAALVTTRVTVADAITAETSGVGGSMSAVLVVRGDALISVDLQQARISTDTNARMLVLDLPRPAVIQARVDHQRTKVFALQRHGLWRLMRLDQVTRRLVDDGLREAQQTVQRAAGEETILSSARQHAEHVLTAFAQSTGWKLTVRWGVPAE